MKKLKQINESAFYRLEKKAYLSELLYTPLPQIRKTIERKNELYKVYNRDGRRIEEPVGQLKFLQKRIKNLLGTVETPSWLLSGKKGKSIVDNAKAHIENPYMICADIESFYKNVSREAVYQMFLHNFKIAPDVAFLLTDIVIFKDKNQAQFVPTGSPSSQIIAYWAYSKTFIEIEEYARSLGIIMTLYVDDITLSSQEIIGPIAFKNISNRLNAVGLHFKKKKIHKFGPNSNKIVTGNCITARKELMPKNSLMHEVVNMVEGKKIEDFDTKTLRCLFGKICFAKYQNPNVLEELYKKVYFFLRLKLKQEQF